MRVLVRAAFLAALVVAIAVPASADHGDIHPTARSERTYFHCAGPAKVQNVYAAQGIIPTWDTSEPAGSVQQGEGCGYYENILSGSVHPSLLAAWEGTFTGNLDALTVELHRLLPASGATTTLVVGTVTIDGIDVFAGDITLQPEPSETGASTVSKFSLRRLNYMTEDGDGTIERTVRVTIDSYNEQQSAWVWDTTEVPSGITFNPGSLAGSVIVN
jgi:hypothetical protein